jgi:hypothetical protein
MNMDRFIRSGTVAAILGGLLLAVGSFLRLLPPHYELFSEEAVTTPFAVSSAMRFVGAIFMTWGLVAIYSRQVDRAGRLGLVAIVECLANMALQGGWYSPTSSSHQPSPKPHRRSSTPIHPDAWAWLAWRVVRQHVLRPAGHSEPTGPSAA